AKDREDARGRGQGDVAELAAKLGALEVSEVVDPVEQNIVETTMGGAGKSGSCTSGPASACSSRTSREIWGRGKIVANIVPFAAGVADLPREQLRARAQKRLDDYVGTIPSKHVRLRQENGVLRQLGRDFLAGVLQEGLAREESRRTVAQLNRVSKRTAVPRPLGTENKALLNAQQTYSCRPWGSRPESEPVLLRSPGQTSHTMVLHEKEYFKKLPEMQEWTFTGDLSRLEGWSTSRFRLPLLFYAEETMLEHSIGNPVGFRGWQKGAILSRSSQPGPAPEEPFFEARGLRYSRHERGMHDLVLKFSAIPVSRDTLEELLDFKRGITQRSQFPTNWLLAEGDGVFTFIRCRENPGGAMA
ncbi:unnamed protein product, partial [Amoebophrya sp. A120]